VHGEVGWVGDERYDLNLDKFHRWQDMATQVHTTIRRFWNENMDIATPNLHVMIHHYNSTVTGQF
jgi:hypothetical protein